MAPARRVLLGRIARAHGSRGEVAIVPYTARPQDIAAYGPLSGADGARFTITHVRSTGRGVLARLAGVDDRTAAEALRGVELYVDRDRLPVAAEGEFYHTDLIGLAVVDTRGQHHGEVLAVCNFGAGDLLEIGHSGSGDSAFVPFTEANVPQVDLALGRLIIALPPAEEGEPS
jgi:16S rRNA processing protein RimM